MGYYTDVITPYNWDPFVQKVDFFIEISGPLLEKWTFCLKKLERPRTVSNSRYSTSRYTHMPGDFLLHTNWIIIFNMLVDMIEINLTLLWERAETCNYGESSV